MRPYLLTFLLAVLFVSACSSGKRGSPPTTTTTNAGQQQVSRESTRIELITGAEQTAVYVPMLKGKRVGIVANPTSIIGPKHLVDTLRSLGVNIIKAFGPEHGFRGQASDGAKVQNDVDTRTGIPIISLYGSHTKPTPADLKGVDIMIFDIQDVGARFYTYISTLHLIMEACAENNVELMILDRPNPNAYIDGPIREEKYKSFIGMHPIPITHGMTIGEYARMINGEGWLNNKIQCKLNIIKLQNYTHTKPYTLPVKPSPNLNTQQSILLYPSLCLFEGTVISVGRGTQMPFQILGNPKLEDKYKFSFTPVAIPGMSETPLHQNEKCYGLDLRNYDTSNFIKTGRLNLQWLIEMYKAYPEKDKFFDHTLNKRMNNFDRLAGTENLKKQIISGKSEDEIRRSWEPGLSQFKLMRKKYLLYQ
ncbi:exo-beta-N-acetylmuramidase NamZ domain-containing protein [Paradesertivirga mongoliensis]|uniref:Exo-beta-N-acetylmuramidase NamZ domain-containing protein n=1 Tax=Paradesertivirga mongoliensis TaxID=2100740 RepID=A0ABW4ZM63_9SPHI|nr:DUF1343 domain-containing protein [Pedobacter mongoliensis]